MDKKLDRFSLARIMANTNHDEVISALELIGILDSKAKYAEYWELNDYLVSLLPLPSFLKNYLNEKIKGLLETWVLKDQVDPYVREKKLLRDAQNRF